MINTSGFEMPDNLVISSLFDKLVTMVYMHPTKGSLSFSIEEPSLAYAISDFLQYLKTSNYVHTQEYTIKAVKVAMKRA